MGTTAAARSSRPAGERMFGGASTSSRAVFVQRATSAARSATAPSVPSPADHEAVDAGRRRAAPPPAAVVGADDGALGQRAHLLLDGEGQRRVERPGDRPSAAARAHRTRGGGPQALGVGIVRHDGQRSSVRVHHRDRIGLRHGPLRRAQLQRPLPGGRHEIGADRVPRSHDNDHDRRHHMTWVKPKFEIVELCSEVTSYLFQR